MRPKVREGASRRPLCSRRRRLLPLLPAAADDSARGSLNTPAPQVHQRPWQRRAVQYAAYAFWPLLLLWIITSYPGSGSASRRHGPAGASLRGQQRRAGVLA